MLKEGRKEGRERQAPTESLFNSISLRCVRPCLPRSQDSRGKMLRGRRRKMAPGIDKGRRMAEELSEVDGKHRGMEFMEKNWAAAAKYVEGETGERDGS